MCVCACARVRVASITCPVVSGEEDGVRRGTSVEWAFVTETGSLQLLRRCRVQKEQKNDSAVYCMTGKDRHRGQAEDMRAERRRGMRT